MRSHWQQLMARLAAPQAEQVTWRLWLPPGALLILDQLTKWAAIHLLPAGGWLTSWGGLVPVLNRGVAFSLPLPNWAMGLILPAALLLLLGWLRLQLQAGAYQRAAALLMIIAGAFSNLLDRASYGGVLDIIYVQNFSTFNLADIMIVGGAGWLIFNRIKK